MLAFEEFSSQGRSVDDLTALVETGSDEPLRGRLYPGDCFISEHSGDQWILHIGNCEFIGTQSEMERQLYELWYLHECI